MSVLAEQTKKPPVINVKRGDIYYARVGKGQGSEQNGIRPVIIIQNNVGNRNSPTTIVAFITSINKKVDLPVHVELPKDISRLREDSIVLLEQLRTIDKSRLLRKISTMNEEFMEKVNESLLISIGIDSSYL